MTIEKYREATEILEDIQRLRNNIRMASDPSISIIKDGRLLEGAERQKVMTRVIAESCETILMLECKFAKL